jgi:hypothetical protein
MENNNINFRVNKEIDAWISEQLNFNGNNITISQNARDFIVELITNIKEDPSDFWTDLNLNSSQDIAISNIQSALNTVVRYRPMRYRLRGIKSFRKNDIVITSWEIWDVLSRILVDFCFIPLKDM